MGWFNHQLVFVVGRRSVKVLWIFEMAVLGNVLDVPGTFQRFFLLRNSLYELTKIFALDDLP